jgi:hypothetical protein
MSKPRPRGMTVEDAEKEFQRIRLIMDDDESAHIEEDSLMLKFIAEIADGLHTKKNAIEVAGVILKTQGLNFSRWYA